MTPGQNRVVVLLLILLGLEVIRIPALKNFFHNAYGVANTTLGSQQT